MTEPSTEPAVPCWICTQPADSSEHRLKKSDLVRRYGRGPYSPGAAPVHFKGKARQRKIIQGPAAGSFKYAPSLCHACNTTKSQPWDRAYETFIDWIFENEDQAIYQRLVDFKDVYGESYSEGQLNLFKYFVKSFGCRIVDAKQKVPADLLALLSQQRFRTWLKITFSVNEFLMALPDFVRRGHLGKGEMHTYASEDPAVEARITWAESIEWLNVHYWYAYPSTSGLGPVWIADARHIYFGVSHTFQMLDAKANELLPGVAKVLMEKRRASGAPEDPEQ